jgi:hypothetical protein
MFSGWDERILRGDFDAKDGKKDMVMILFKWSAFSVDPRRGWTCAYKYHDTTAGGGLAI